MKAYWRENQEKIEKEDEKIQCFWNFIYKAPKIQGYLEPSLKVILKEVNIYYTIISIEIDNSESVEDDSVGLQFNLFTDNNFVSFICLIILVS